MILTSLSSIFNIMYHQCKAIPIDDISASELNDEFFKIFETSMVDESVESTINKKSASLKKNTTRN